MGRDVLPPLQMWYMTAVISHLKTDGSLRELQHPIMCFVSLGIDSCG